MVDWYWLYPLNVNSDNKHEFRFKFRSNIKLTIVFSLKILTKTNKTKLHKTYFL